MFIRLYKKLSPDIQKKVKKTLSLFRDNPSHTSLAHKKMASQENIYEIRVSQNYRITYTRKGNIAILRKVGTHNLLRRSRRGIEFLLDFPYPHRKFYTHARIS